MPSLFTLYSHSRLASYEKCPKQFHFRYVLEIPAQTEGIEAFVGKRVHEVLERLYQFVGRGMVPSIEKVTQRYHAFWDEHFDAQKIRIARPGMPVSFYRRNGERCLRNYYRRHYPFDADETLGIEEPVLFDLDESGSYQIRGIIDRIARAPDGAIEIQDYKTGQRVPSQKNLDADRQLALYQMGVSQRFGEDVQMRLVWHYVASGQVRTSTRSPEQLQALRGQTLGLIERIEQESDFAPRKMTLCNWCEYKSICPAWSAAEPARAVARTAVARPVRAARKLRSKTPASRSTSDCVQLSLL